MTCLKHLTLQRFLGAVVRVSFACLDGAGPIGPQPPEQGAAKQGCVVACPRKPEFLWAPATSLEQSKARGASRRAKAARAGALGLMSVTSREVRHGCRNV
jgi:hypothetical protein